MSDSLVRVSRRAEWGAHRPVPGARRYIAETARAANHDRRDGISTSLSTARLLAAAPIPHRSTPRVDRRTGYRRSTSDRGDASPAPIRFPPDNFKHSLTLFSKSFSSFPRGGLGPGPPLRTLLQTYNSDSEAGPIFKLADPGSLAVTKGILGSTMILPQVHLRKLLLRLLLPLMIRFSGILATSPAANRPRRRDPNTSPDHSIGRSDGRLCTKGRDVSQRELMTRAY
ncbi:hypothetical protein L1887_56859 [Cichorium endivia]|nr:hypothetical protein L1887_56859 [Cichorium endivia]